MITRRSFLIRMSAAATVPLLIPKPQYEPPVTIPLRQPGYKGTMIRISGVSVDEIEWSHGAVDETTFGLCDSQPVMRLASEEPESFVPKSVRPLDWELAFESELLDTTALGDTYRRVEVGRRSCSLSANFMIDNDSSQPLDLIRDVHVIGEPVEFDMQKSMNSPFHLKGKFILTEVNIWWPDNRWPDGEMEKAGDIRGELHTLPWIKS